MKLVFEGDSIVAILNQMTETMAAIAKNHNVDVEAVPQQAPRKSKVKAPPEPVIIDEADPVEEMMEESVDAKAQAAVDLLKLKNEQLDRLRDLFNAGKGPFVRELLAKYGDGAKVFPEVDAVHFPAIKADIDRELN